jgi:hypothetical protein
LYSSPNIIRMIKSRRIWWAGHVARMRADRNAYRVLMGKSKGRPRGWWVDNIIIYLDRIEWYGLYWSDSE